MGLTSRHTKSARAGMREAGDLLGVEAIFRTGIVVRSDGAMVRILRAFPPNPLVMDADGRAQLAESFCELAQRLGPGQALQYYVQARPIPLDEILGGCQSEVAAWAGLPPTRDRVVADRRAQDRWRLYAAMEQSIRLHADEQAAVDLAAYVVVPFLPTRRQARQILGQLKRPGRPRAALERALRAHRRVVRESMAHTDRIRGELDGMEISNRQLNGQEVVELLWSRFNPTTADRRRRPPHFSGEILGELDAVREGREARQAALRLRAAIARSTIDFDADPNHVVVERDLEQTIYAASTADATHFGWLLNAMVACRQPHSVAVHVHALDRKSERQRLKLSYRRRFMINRDRESKGRPPDFDGYAAEHEQERLLMEMSGHERAGLYQLSIYHATRAQGPQPDVGVLDESVSQVAELLGSASDCTIDAGKHQQRELWPSTLPLGDDIAARRRKYATRNVGDSTPLLGTSVGSPEGIPFAFSTPARTLERWNPRDREHHNQVTLVSGRSGSGKTVTCNALLARSIALGARGFVVDRAGHYRTLTQLIDGAQHFDIGTDDGCALNPWDVDDVARVGREKVAFLIGLHETMLVEGLTTLERAQIGAAIRAVYERCHLEGLVPRESLLVEELLDRATIEQTEGSAEIAFTLRSLAERLGEFVGDGSYAHVADRESTHVPDAPLLVFDTENCPEAVLQPVLFVVLEYIKRAAIRHRDEHRQLAVQEDAPLMAGCSIFVGDEFWRFVVGPLGVYANDLARRSRRFGLTVMIATQQLSDLDNEHGRALVSNSTQQIFLGQHRDELTLMQRVLGLADAEVKLIARLRTVKGAYAEVYWVNGTRGRSQVTLPLGPLEYWAYTSEPYRDVPLREQKVAEHGGDAWAAVVDLAGYRESRAKRGVAGQLLDGVVRAGRAA
ncbi:VirB4 family type IV secretion system protein [Conexibacter sp. CPCC 206217]|uniref:VirB4 family type IV secretion system protein n=1 Tax=Conexibacter sp. CPCC 206217 TaxID=3064574 RepID=UPI0027193388|nr:hypothetical protein [Conexibacter sp. CPCC 206217]MDO8208993.1 hypothetical protein [Conexibacter sp. CPCC 206217]